MRMRNCLSLSLGLFQLAVATACFLVFLFTGWGDIGMLILGLVNVFCGMILITFACYT